MRVHVVLLGIVVCLLSIAFILSNDDNSISNNISGFVVAESNCPDYTNNGIVDFMDFLSFVNNYGLSPGEQRGGFFYDVRYDYDESGLIDFTDFLQFARNYGKECTLISPGALKPTESEFEKLKREYSDLEAGFQAVMQSRNWTYINNVGGSLDTKLARLCTLCNNPSIDPTYYSYCGSLKCICVNGVKDAGESGIDCGGNCPKICNLYYETDEAFCTSGQYSLRCPPGSCVQCPQTEGGKPTCFDVSTGYIMQYPSQSTYQPMIGNTIGCFDGKWDICGCFSGSKTSWDAWMKPWDSCEGTTDKGVTRPGKLGADKPLMQAAYLCWEGQNEGAIGTQYTKMKWYACQEQGRGFYINSNWWACTAAGWVNKGPGGSCSDGVKNADETGVDCGGGHCPACSSCNDGIKNGNETGVDCGGSCPACASCNDSIKNGNETGVDCGGSCLPCGIGLIPFELIITIPNSYITHFANRELRASVEPNTYAFASGKIYIASVATDTGNVGAIPSKLHAVDRVSNVAEEINAEQFRGSLIDPNSITRIYQLVKGKFLPSSSEQIAVISGGFNKNLVTGMHFYLSIIEPRTNIKIFGPALIDSVYNIAGNFVPAGSWITLFSGGDKAGHYQKAVLAADIDNDGIDELVLRGMAGQDKGIIVLKFVGGSLRELFSIKGDNSFYLSSFIGQVWVADVSPEQGKEFVFYKKSGGTGNHELSVYSANGAKLFDRMLDFSDTTHMAQGVGLTLNTDNIPFWTASGDIDGDGYDELVTPIATGTLRSSDYKGGIVAYSIKDGQRRWYLPIESTIKGGTIPVSVDIVDVTGDGRPEVVYSRMNVVWVLDGRTGTPLEGWPKNTEESYGGVWTSCTPAFYDLNADGSKEILFAVPLQLSNTLIVGVDGHGKPVRAFKFEGHLTEFKSLDAVQKGVNGILLSGVFPGLTNSYYFSFLEAQR